MSKNDLENSFIDVQKILNLYIDIRRDNKEGKEPFPKERVNEICMRHQNKIKEIARDYDIKEEDIVITENVYTEKAFKKLLRLKIILKKLIDHNSNDKELLNLIAKN